MLGVCLVVKCISGASTILAFSVPGKDVLEFGAGHGVLGLALAPSCASVTLIDVAPKMVAQAKEKIAAKGLEKTVKAYCVLVPTNEMCSEFLWVEHNF